MFPFLVSLQTLSHLIHDALLKYLTLIGTFFVLDKKYTRRGRPLYFLAEVLNTEVCRRQEWSHCFYNA